MTSMQFCIIVAYDLCIIIIVLNVYIQYSVWSWHNASANALHLKHVQSQQNTLSVYLIDNLLSGSKCALIIH